MAHFFYFCMKGVLQLGVTKLLLEDALYILSRFFVSI